MPLEYRLRRLERRARTIGSATCTQCGAPVPGVNLYIALNEAGEPRWGRCGSCGLALDDQGLPCAAFPAFLDGVPVTSKFYAAGAAVELV